MSYLTIQPRSAAIWALVARQHGVIAHCQLIDLGMHPQTIKHRIATGRLHRVHRGVYAVGRPDLTRCGDWMAAVLACGEGAVLSHHSAATLSGFCPDEDGPIAISIPGNRRATIPGLRVHRRRPGAFDGVTARDGIPVTSATRALVDIAPSLSRGRLERAIGEADKLGLFTPDELRRSADAQPRWPGSRKVRETLDRHTFTLTETELERQFLSLAAKAGLPLPLTGARVTGFKVDFYWPDLSLVVETDGLRYHRTPAQQARDHRRDQAHTAAGLTPLRFTHAQIYYEPADVVATLARVAARLGAVAGPRLNG